MHDPHLASEASGPPADALLEMTGLSVAQGAICAVLTPTMKVRLREMGPGQVLEVRVDDLSAREDIASWCRLVGHELLAVIEGPPGILRCFVRKKAD